jgi:Ser/Thr protein kinase RdoA (MazF antagonist)
VLRAYRNRGNLPHVRFEHALLARLAQMPLSFRVPVPLPSLTGHTLEPVEVNGQVVHASLSHLIPGEHPRDWTDLRWVRAVGTALGELDVALARVVMPEGVTALPVYGDLDRIHGAVPSPETAVSRLPLDPVLRWQFGEYLARARAAIPGLYNSLPQQIIHSDLAGSNLLLQQGRVTGILDFEFASRDLRVMDLAVAVGQMSFPPGSDVPEAPFVRALAQGYGASVRLTPAEFHAIPDLLLLRSAVTVIHRVGRWLEGLSPSEAVESRIRDALGLERWLARGGAGLIEWLVTASSETVAEGGQSGSEDVMLDHQPEESR